MKGRNLSSSAELSTSSYSNFVKSVRQLGSIITEDNMELLEEYKAGDISARDKLIIKNFLFIISRVRGYACRSESMNLEDFVNEGVLGFIKGLDGFNLGSGSSLLTYAGTAIKTHMLDVLGDKDKLVRRPRYLDRIVNKYKRLAADYATMGMQLPDDPDELKILLGGVSSYVVDTIKYDENYDPLSLNMMVGEEENAEFGDFIGKPDDYSDVTMEDKELCAYFKLTLNPYNYYVLYNRILNDVKIKQLPLAESLNTTRSTISMLENDMKRRIRALYASGDFSEKRARYLQRKGVNLETFNIEPLLPDTITSYLFIRDTLSNVERGIFRLLMHDNLVFDEKLFARLLDISVARLRSECRNLERKLVRLEEDLKDVYIEFKNSIICRFGTGIFNVNLDMDLSNNITMRDIVLKSWNDKDINVVEMLSDEDYLDPSLKRLVSLYSEGDIDSRKYAPIDKAEKQINYLLSREDSDFTITGNSKYAIISVMKSLKDRLTIDVLRTLIDMFEIEFRELLTEHEESEIIGHLSSIGVKSKVLVNQQES